MLNIVSSFELAIIYTHVCTHIQIYTSVHAYRKSGAHTFARTYNYLFSRTTHTTHPHQLALLQFIDLYYYGHGFFLRIPIRLLSLRKTRCCTRPSLYAPSSRNLMSLRESNYSCSSRFDKRNDDTCILRCTL